VEDDVVRRLALVAAFLVMIPLRVAAQENAALVQARQAYEALDYRSAIVSVRRALGQQLAGGELVEAYEMLGFMYAALDSTSQAVEAFRNLIILDPDREPDALRVSPQITSLYAGQVLVVRRVGIDSASFVAGSGRVPLRFDVSQPAAVRVRAVGDGIDVQVDSLFVPAVGGVFWSPVLDDGTPVPPGRYRLMIEAFARPEQYAAQTVVEVRHGAVDTLAHVTSLEGYDFLDEVEQPGRNWRPLGLAALYTAVASAASLALENSGLGSPTREEIAGVSGAVLLTGFIMSLKKPDSRPVPANIEYNRLLRDQIAQRNADIARENDVRRSQVQMTVVPVAGGTQ
jgi:hypothetical protein